MPTPTWIATPSELAQAVARWQRLDELALDTEFVFERTFRPQLGLVQVATADEIALVDPVALPDLGALAPVLAAPSPRKLVHAGAADVAVLRRAAGVSPRPLLDTQIAAAFAGLGTTLSYGALVEALTGVVLGKHETRTNWLARPLRAEQVRYAAEDVEHLPRVARALERRLAELGRLEWAIEESQRVAEGGDEIEPDEAWRRVKGLERLPPRLRPVARALAAWREREAARRDLSRPFLLRDETLVALVRRASLTPREAVKLPGYDARRHAQHVETWRAALAQAHAEAAAAGADDRAPRHWLPLDRLKELGSELAAAVARRAAALELSPELLLSRRQRGRLVQSWDGERPLSAGLGGFRRELLGRELDEVGARFARPR